LDDFIQRCGEGVIPKGKGSNTARSYKSFLGRFELDVMFYSHHSQWLPCEVKISESNPNSVR